MASPTSELTIVIPAYDESRRIEARLREIDAYVASERWAADVLVVDDGSTDDTAGVVERLARDLAVPVAVVRSQPNQGKGYAVRTGVLRAEGRLVLVTDADLSTPMTELSKLAPAARDGVPVVIGSRHMEGSAVEVHQPRLREAMGEVFTTLTSLLVVRVSDVTCGFKVFTREAARDIFSRVTLSDWSYDAEALFLARRLGYEIREVPVRWRDAPGTKVRRTRDAVASLVGLGRILVNAATGRYDRAPAER
ncbi:MAG TPA: dolichyl-phosphate beta-glucosyltransferase [Candidatus Eisenbacteria bacterium]|nr:dolichyl-phosphate beta-glucosyltransferase [Candidatus Eisenbacteria bacterium]